VDTQCRSSTSPQLNRQRLLAIPIAQPKESGQVGYLVAIKMAYSGHQQVAKLCSGLAEAKESPASHVDEHFCLAADPEQITRRRPLRIDSGSTGAQNLYRSRSQCTALCNCCRGRGETDHA
jgi:hypothetical protein